MFDGGCPVNLQRVAGNLTVCGLSGALSAIESEPVIEPAFVGLKVTVIVQLLPGLTVDPQLFAE
jgi:hypothetical protein